MAPLLNRNYKYCAVIEQKVNPETNQKYYADRDGTPVTLTTVEGRRGFLYPDNVFIDDYMERVTNADTGKRYYATKTGNLSSVTTILDATADKSGLEAWRKRVGDVEAERIRKEATNLGSLMHTHLENHIMDIPRPGGNNLIRKMAKEMSDVIIECGLKNLSEVWGMEEGLYYPELWAGTTDLIGIYRGEPAILDYKSAKKMKSEDMIEDYFCQLAAYAIAHNDAFGTNISSAVILMVDRNLKFKEFVISGKTFSKHSDRWIGRVEQFYKAA